MFPIFIGLGFTFAFSSIMYVNAYHPTKSLSEEEKKKKNDDFVSEKKSKQFKKQNEYLDAKKTIVNEFRDHYVKSYGSEAGFRAGFEER